MKRLGLANVRREPYRMAASWERGPASAALVSGGSNRALAVASYTWTPGTQGTVEGEVVDVGAGRPGDVRRVTAQVKGRVALVVPEGADLDSVIYNFYRAPGLVRELKDAGALAVLIAADKPHAILYTAPVEFSATGRLAALPTVSLAHEDVELLRRLLRQGQTPRVRLDVRNKIGGAFETTNVVGEVRHSRGRAQPHPLAGRDAILPRPPYHRRHARQDRAARLRLCRGDARRDHIHDRRPPAALRPPPFSRRDQTHGRRDEGRRTVARRRNLEVRKK